MNELFCERTEGIETYQLLQRGQHILLNGLEKPLPLATMILIQSFSSVELHVRDAKFIAYRGDSSDVHEIFSQDAQDKEKRV